MGKGNSEKTACGSALEFEAQYGKVMDDAVGGIGRKNPTLKDVPPRDDARPRLDKARLGGLVDIICNIGLTCSAAKSKDLLSRVYEYVLGTFASAAGEGGVPFYTPQCVVQLLVAMLEPCQGLGFNLCCCSGGVDENSKRPSKKVWRFTRSPHHCILRN
jgi:type I restriction enzyme M protein